MKKCTLRLGRLTAAKPTMSVNMIAESRRMAPSVHLKWREDGKNKDPLPDRDNVRGCCRPVNKGSRHQQGHRYLRRMMYSECSATAVPFPLA